MTGEEIIAAAMARRTKLLFRVPDRNEPFTCYPKDAAQSDRWLQQAADRGWTLIAEERGA